MKKIILIISIIILFGLGPLGIGGVLETTVNLKYWVRDPRAMGLEKNGDLTQLEKELNRDLYISWTMAILGPVSAIGLLLYNRHSKKTNSNSLSADTST
jgi:hypothetical protein